MAYKYCDAHLLAHGLSISSTGESRSGRLGDLRGNQEGTICMSRPIGGRDKSCDYPWDLECDQRFYSYLVVCSLDGLLVTNLRSQTETSISSIPGRCSSRRLLLTCERGRQ